MSYSATYLDVTKNLGDEYKYYVGLAETTFKNDMEPQNFV